MEAMLALAAIVRIIPVELAHVAFAPASIMIVGIGAEGAFAAKAFPIPAVFVKTAAVAMPLAEHHPKVTISPIASLAPVAALAILLAVRSAINAVAVADIAVRHVHSSSSAAKRTAGQSDAFATISGA